MINFPNIPTQPHEITALLDRLYPINQAVKQSDAFYVEQVRRDFPILGTQVHGNPLIWLDNGATSQKPSVMIEAINRFYKQENSNIHRGNHTLALQATEQYDLVRQKVARYIHAKSAQEIVFVRGATEAINLVEASFGKKFIQDGDEVIITMLEHHSNILPWQEMCKEKGAVLRIASIDQNGEIILEQYAALLSHKTKIVALAHVSNVLGTILPVQQMTAMAHKHGACVLLDGAQAVPHLQIDVQELDCDFYVFSAHKMFAPTGIGVLYGKLALLNALPPWQVGGGMIKQVSFTQAEYADVPAKFEAGTSNISAVMGFGATLDYLNHIDFAAALQHEKRLMQYALRTLEKIPRLELIGNPKERAGAIPFKLHGVQDEALGKHLDREGIAIRIGHHCAQPTLAFFGYQAIARPGLAFYNTQQEIDRLANALDRAR